MTKLIASMVVYNERSRYLTESITALLRFCDEVRVLDDGSTDGSAEWLRGHYEKDRTPTLTVEHGFFEHEGRTRQKLLDWTLEGEPTHILAIDADEFISDGQSVRDAVSGDGEVWTLQMTEIWSADENGLSVRVDRLWGPHSVGVLYAVPRNRNLHILDRALACGREPLEIRQTRHPNHLNTQILHFGWANPAERMARYQRYAVHDGGQFHANAHLLSIIDGKEVLKHQDWPEDLLVRKEDILRCTRYAPTAADSKET